MTPGRLNVALNNWLRGFFLGYALETVPQLVGLLLPRAAEKRRSGLASVLHDVILRSDAVPFGAFLGTMCASYPLAKELIGRAIPGVTPDHPLASAGAGAVAFAAIGLDAAPHGIDRRVTFALYLLVRAAESAGESLVHRGLLPSIPHIDTILFQLSCTEIMYSWFFTPHTLPRAYVSWITKMAMMDTRLLDYLRAFREGRLWYGKDTDIMKAMSSTYGVIPDIGNPVTGFCPCLFVHPEDGYSCNRHTLHRFWISFVQALVIYLPVHTVPSLLFRFGHFRSNPLSFAINNLLAASRSAAFLGVFISTIYTCICFVRNRVKDETIFGPLLGSTMCGFSLLIEKKSRRMELALYCVPRALFSVYLKLHEAGRIPYIKNFDWMLFAISGAAMMYFAEHEPTTIRPSILSFMRWLFDLPRTPTGSSPDDALGELKKGAPSSTGNTSSSSSCTPPPTTLTSLM